MKNCPISPACQLVPQARNWIRSAFSMTSRPTAPISSRCTSPGVEAHAPEQGVADRAGLLVDLLEHEVTVAALLRLNRVPRDRLFLERLRLALGVHDPQGVRLDHRDRSLRERRRTCGCGREAPEHPMRRSARPRRSRPRGAAPASWPPGDRARPRASGRASRSPAARRPRARSRARESRRSRTRRDAPPLRCRSRSQRRRPPAARRSFSSR